MLHDNVVIHDELDRLCRYANQTERRSVSKILLSADYIDKLLTGGKLTGTVSGGYFYKGVPVEIVPGLNRLKINTSKHKLAEIN